MKRYMKNVIVITDRKMVEEWRVNDYLTAINMIKSSYSWEWRPDDKPTLQQVYSAPIESRIIDGKSYLIAVFPGAADEQEIIKLIRAKFY